MGPKTNAGQDPDDGEKGYSLVWLEANALARKTS